MFANQRPDVIVDINGWIADCAEGEGSMSKPGPQRRWPSSLKSGDSAFIAVTATSAGLGLVNTVGLRVSAGVAFGNALA